MATGFFGGLSEGIQAGLQRNQTGDYQQKLLEIEQQRLKNQQQRQLHSQATDNNNVLLTAASEYIKQAKLANPNISPKDLQQHVQGMVDMLEQSTSALGLPRGYYQSQVTAAIAAPSEAVSQAALARAKEGPQHRDLVQSEINKNNATAGIDVNNPDRPGTGANGPALGQKSAQAAQPDAPQVLSWADARSKLSEKYDPNLVNKAELWLKGNQSVVSGLRGGRGSEREKIQNAAMELARLTGTTTDQVNQNFLDFKGKAAASTASGRTAGTRITNLDIILRRADGNVDAAITASDNVPRSDFVPLNSGIQWAQAKFSSEPLKIFQQKNLALAEDWAKSMNPTGVMRIEDRNLALDVLNTAIGSNTYAAAAHAVRDTIGLELTAAKKYLKERGFSGSSSQDESSGSEPGPGGVRVHGFTFTPTGQ